VYQPIIKWHGNVNINLIKVAMEGWDNPLPIGQSILVIHGGEEPCFQCLREKVSPVARPVRGHSSETRTSRTFHIYSTLQYPNYRIITLPTTCFLHLAFFIIPSAHTQQNLPKSIQQFPTHEHHTQPQRSWPPGEQQDAEETPRAHGPTREGPLKEYGKTRIAGNNLAATARNRKLPLSV